MLSCQPKIQDQHIFSRSQEYQKFQNIKRDHRNNKKIHTVICHNPFSLPLYLQIINIRKCPLNISSLLQEKYLLLAVIHSKLSLERAVIQRQNPYDIQHELHVTPGKLDWHSQGRNQQLDKPNLSFTIVSYFTFMSQTVIDHLTSIETSASQFVKCFLPRDLTSPKRSPQMSCKHPQVFSCHLQCIHVSVL